MRSFFLLLILFGLLTSPAIAQTAVLDIQHSGTMLAQVNDDASLVVTGTFGTGVIPITGAGSRLMWYPARAAFRAGRVSGAQWNEANVGDYSVALGQNTTASGNRSTAMGQGTTASGHRSTAMGWNTTASGLYSTATGNGTTASSTSTTAMGSGTHASGSVATAMGLNTTASGTNATAMGFGTTAGGTSATALGDNTEASGIAATAMGFGTTASGNYATAMGLNTTASGDQATAMGDGTTASGDGALALGEGTQASGINALAMGFNATASGFTATAMGDNATASGVSALAVGRFTTASASTSMALGYFASTNNMAGSFVFGDRSTDAVVLNTAANQFMVRAAGGTIFYSNSLLTAGVSLAPGAGSWSNVSDRRKKENFRSEDGETVLAQIARLPILSWNYKAQPDSIRHLGPTAQDFHAAFHLGESDTTITTTDIDGVNLLAIQALERRTAELRARTAELEALQRELASVYDRLGRLEAILGLASSPPAASTAPRR